MRAKELFSRLIGTLRGFGFKQWFLLILNTVLVAATIASAVGLSVVSNTLGSVRRADAFRGESDMRFAQIACFLPVGKGKEESDILSFRQTLDTKLMEQSLEAPENGSLYIDAYSTSATVTVSSDSSGSGGSAQVEAVAVGGEFFYFHPLQLRSGAYISSDDLMDDLVVLDEELAWRLFGGVELEGMTITLNGKPFVVAGVVSRESDFATKKAYSGEAGLFMSYSALKRLDETAAISCYEIIMPDPITNFAMGVVQEAFPPEENDVVENSSRYSLGHLLSVIGSFGDRSMRVNGVIYPYWENAVRLTEDYASLLLILTVLFALCPLTFVVVLVVKNIVRGYRKVKKAVPEKVEAMIEQRREERLEREYEKKAGGE